MANVQLLDSLSDVDHGHDYFGPWAMLPKTAQMMCTFSSWYNVNVPTHIGMEREIRSALPQPESGSGGSVEDYHGGIREIEISGLMMKRSSSLFHSTSTIWARRAVRNAVNAEHVRGIILRIDSPGGTVAGTADLARDISKAAKVKPVTAYVEDIGASAAYWIASQANRVVSNSTALIGSIGTFVVVDDSSEAAKKQGVKVHVLRAGAFKGRTVPGVKIDREVLDYLQATIDGLNQFFLRDVAAGRKLNSRQLAAVSDGRVHVGNDARRLGLIDGVESFDDAVEQLVKQTRK